MKSKVIIILTAVLMAVALSVAGLNIYTNMERSRGNTLPMPLGCGLGMVMTGSMGDSIPPGSLILVLRTGSYEVGDVVAYQVKPGDVHTVHRIVETEGDIITTRGDANDDSDDPIHRDSIKGEVVLSVPGLGVGLTKMTEFLRRPWVTGLILAAATALMILSLVADKRQKTAAPTAEELREEIRRLKEQSEGEEASREPFADSHSDQE